MSEIHSPFLKDMRKCRSKSKNIRKKIYKYLMSKNNKTSMMGITANLKQILLQKPLPISLIEMLSDKQNLTIDSIERIDFKVGVGLTEIRLLADHQQRTVSQLNIQRDYPCSTVKKRRILGSITNYQSAQKRQLFFSTANQQQSEQFSLQEDIPQISMFNSSLFESKKQKEDELFHLKDNISICQIENRPSNKSSSLFEQAIHIDPLDFI